MSVQAHIPTRPVDLDRLAESVAGTFPPLTDRGRRIALDVYRTLALGEPVPDYAIAAGTRLTIGEVVEEMADWHGIYRNESGRISGFWGLALEETVHPFEVDGRQLYTWCAWDTLFLPEVLGREAQVRSSCSATGEPIHLRVGADGVTSNIPDTVVSFIDPDVSGVDCERIISSFCHHILFFSSREVGAEWVRKKGDGSILLSLGEAFDLGRTYNTLRFGSVLDSA